MAQRPGWLVSNGRLRTPWRILIYTFLLFLLYIAGEYAASVLPRSPLGWVNYIVLTGAAVVAGSVMLVHFDGRRPGALGFALTRHAPREIAAGYLIGGILIGVTSLLLLVSGTARFIPDSGTPSEYVYTLVWTLAFFTLAAAYEEAWFRGYVFQVLVTAVGVWPTVLASSAVFSLVHAGNPNVGPIALVNIFLAGVLLAWAYLRTRSLWFATTLHAGWNWVMATAFGFPVSGLILMDTPLYDAIETGDDWWTGGAFGPEAGLAATLFLLGGIVWTIRTSRLREPEEVRLLRPIVDSRLGEDST